MYPEVQWNANQWDSFVRNLQMFSEIYMEMQRT